MFANPYGFYEILWYSIVYMIGAYLRLYPNKITTDKMISVVAFILSATLSIVSVIVCCYKCWWPFYFLADSNKLLALMFSVSIFLLFKNIDIGQKKIINTIASTAFGVLCIHANCNEMREWLWQEFWHVPEMYYSSSFFGLIYKSLACVLVTFIVCCIIDLFRINLIEKPFMKFITNNDGKISALLKKCNLDIYT